MTWGHGWKLSPCTFLKDQKKTCISPCSVHSIPLAAAQGYVIWWEAVTSQHPLVQVEKLNSCRTETSNWPLLARLSGHLLPYFSILPVLFWIRMENFRLMGKLHVAEGLRISISHSHHCRAVSSRASTQLPLSASLPDSPPTLLSPLWKLKETKDINIATKEMSRWWNLGHQGKGQKGQTNMRQSRFHSN